MATSINAIRLKNNPLEKRFVDEWEKWNEDGKLLKFIFDRTRSQTGNYYPTEVEKEIAVTVIQWLGTPVGQSFLEEVDNGL